MTKRDAEWEPYWTEDCLLGELPLLDGPALVRLRLHQTWEAIPDRRPLVPLTQLTGSRVYVHTQPYVLEPDIALTMNLHRTAPAAGAIGTVVESTWEGMRHVAIGQAQAWLYPADRLLLLWECYLLDPYRQDDPLRDPALAALWQGFEAELVRRFPDADRLATSAWENLYNESAWQAFLTQQNYSPSTAGVFSKLISHPSG